MIGPARDGSDAGPTEKKRRASRQNGVMAQLPNSAVADEVHGGQLVAAPLQDTGLRRRLLLAMPGTRRIGFAARGVAEIVVEEMARSVENGAWPSAVWLRAPR